MQSKQQDPVHHSASDLASAPSRFKHFETAIRSVETELAAAHFSAGFGKFREAVNLSRGFASLEDRAASLAVERAKQWLPDYWTLSRSLLIEAAETHSKTALAEELWHAIHLREHEELIRREARVQTVPAPGITTPPALPLQVAVSASTEVSIALKPSPPIESRTPVLEPELHQTVSKSSSTLVFASLCMGVLLTAVTLLVWMHFSPRTPVVGLDAATRLAPPVVQPKADKADDEDNQAWSAVNPADPEAVEQYLSRFPAGVNRPLALKALITYRLGESKAHADRSKTR